MMKLAVFVGGLVVLSVASFTGAKLNCGSIEIKPFMEFIENSTNACNQIKEITKEDKEDYGLDPLKKLTLVDGCLCDLVPRQTIWATMFDDNVAEVYKLIVNAKKDLDYATNEGTLKWLRTYDTYTMFSDDKYNMIKKLLGEAHFKYSTAFNTEGEPEAEAKGRAFLKEACQPLIKSFEPFWSYFSAIIKLTNNRSLVDEMALYDRNMMKSLVVYKACAHPVLANL